MRLQNFILFAVVLTFCSIGINAQFIGGATGVTHLQDNNDRVGIGTTTPDVNAQVNIVRPSTLTYGRKTTLDANISVSGNTAIGDARTLLASGASWYAHGYLYGTYGLVSNVSKIRSAYSNKQTFAVGGLFRADMADAQVTSAVNADVRVAGTWSRLMGTISTFPTTNPNAVAGAVIGEDLINNTYTYGGYFIGKGHFTDKVSIGNVTTPDGYKLYVEDGILTERVKVATVGTADWADYVFEEDYDLNSVEEVESFVKANKHLPNVPSAKEVSEKGIDMVEMDATLLRQVEELWLHVIELNKEMEILRKENSDLRK